MASPIFATAVGLLKHTIDNFGDKTNYVEEFKKITEEPRFAESYYPPLNNNNTNQTPKQEEDEEEDEEVVEPGKKKGIFNKLFTLTKDFFETVPDSEF